MPDWPARVLPWEVTGTGCQCLKPTFAPARSTNSAELFSTAEGDEQGGVSSTPSFERCLFPRLVLAKLYYGHVVLDTRLNLPIHRGDLSGKSAAHEQLPLTLDKGVNAAGLLECRDPAAHPGCAAGEFVVGREDGPVERRLERHEAVHGANGLIAQEGVWQGCGNGFVAVCPVCAVGFVGAVGEAVGGPGRGDLGCVCRVQVLGVLDVRFVLET